MSYFQKNHPLPVKMTSQRKNFARTTLPAFSLLELMIATVLGAILLVTASSMFMLFMVGTASTNARRQMSAEGQQMLGTMQYHIRNAQSATIGSAHSACTTGGTIGNQITLTKLDSTNITFCGTTGSGAKMYYASGHDCNNAAENALNSDFVVSARTMPNYYFTCTQAANGKKTVEIKFNLSTSDDSAITEPFSALVQLRNS